MCVLCTGHYELNLTTPVHHSLAVRLKDVAFGEPNEGFNWYNIVYDMYSHAVKVRVLSCVCYDTIVYDMYSHAVKVSVFVGVGVLTGATVDNMSMRSTCTNTARLCLPAYANTDCMCTNVQICAHTPTHHTQTHTQTPGCYGPPDSWKSVIPTRGTLSFDFVSTSKPPAEAQAVSEYFSYHIMSYVLCYCLFQ